MIKLLFGFLGLLVTLGFAVWRSPEWKALIFVVWWNW